MRGDTSGPLAGPPTAASRIQRQQRFIDMLKESWNRQIAQLFRNTSEMEDRVRNWGERNVLNGNRTTGKYAKCLDLLGISRLLLDS
jgi:hypothetical protein